MSGFASLSWEEWHATTKTAKKRQREECLLWMNQIWENTPLKNWPEEWAHLRSSVRKDTLWNACNASEMEWKGSSIPVLGTRIKNIPRSWEEKYESWVESRVFSRENERAQTWLRL